MRRVAGVLKGSKRGYKILRECLVREKEKEKEKEEKVMRGI